MKITLIIVAVLIIGFLIFNYRSTPAEVDQAVVNEASVITANENSSDESEDRRKELENFELTFTGYGPAGKSHEGVFKNQNFSYEISEEGDVLKNSSVTFKTNSVDTGIERLNTHLCSDDFFDCEKFPEIKFAFNDMKQISEEKYEITGNLSFRGVEKSITFELDQTENEFSGEFLLDVTEFGFKYTAIDKDVLINVKFGL